MPGRVPKKEVQEVDLGIPTGFLLGTQVKLLLEVIAGENLH